MHLLWLLLFGTAIGVASGLLGVGGGVLLIPGLMLLFGFSQPEAQGTSLAVLALPILLFAASVYYRNGQVQPSVAAVIALGLAAGAYLGARLVPYVPAAALRSAFGILLLYVGFLFVVSPTGRSAAALPAGLATAVTTAIGFLLRRKRPPKPAGQVEYHI